MEVFQTNNFYIFVRNGKSLWWNRATSEFSIRAGKYSIKSEQSLKIEKADEANQLVASLFYKGRFVWPATVCIKLLLFDSRLGLILGW